jgi:hypothetical protein
MFSDSRIEFSVNLPQDEVRYQSDRAERSAHLSELASNSIVPRILSHPSGCRTLAC